jgi:hypothetical protein
MLKYLFSGLGVVMFLVLIISYLISGQLSNLNLHLTAYGFILAGIGYIIEELKKKDKTSADHLKYVLIKHHKDLFEEIKSIRTMVLTMESREKKHSEFEHEKDPVEIKKI